jgi:hypothetical protein
MVSIDQLSKFEVMERREGKAGPKSLPLPPTAGRSQPAASLSEPLGEPLAELALAPAGGYTALRFAQAESLKALLQAFFAFFDRAG